MRKLVLLRKVFFLSLMGVLGAVFGPISLQKKDVTDQAVVYDRIQKNVAVVRQYLDEQYGEGFFDEQVAQHVAEEDVWELIIDQEDEEKRVYEG